MKRTVRVVAGVFQRGGRVLVQQRPPRGARGSLWEFPGGKVEPGETDAQALTRECQEELGVEVTVGRLLWSTVHEYADLTVELFLYGAQMATDALPSACEAGGELAWLSPSELASLPFCAADAPFVATLDDGLSG